MTVPPPSIAVVVPTRDRPTLLVDTLRELMRLVPGEVPILVVDQSTGPGTRELVGRLAEHDPRLRYHATSTVGVSAARSLGFQLCATDIVAYVDDDCLISEGWLDGLVAVLKGSAVAGVFGRLIPHERGPRTGIEVGLKDTGVHQEFSGHVPPWHVGHGGNMAFWCRELAAVGGFDPLLGAGGELRACEDGDIAFRLLARGKRLAYTPAAVVYHRHWKSWNAQRAMERAYGLGAGAQFAKYVRCGNLGGLRLFASWTWELGVRRVGAGLLKWHSRRVVYLGYCQLVYPTLGMLRSLRKAVDRDRVVYRTTVPAVVPDRPSRVDLA